MNKAFEEEPWKRILVDASSESVESVAKGTWAASPADPAQDPRDLYGIRRYGAAKLFQIMMMCVFLIIARERLHAKILIWGRGTVPSFSADSTQTRI